jgi:phosphopantothenoylcysteine decarboxylase/phosphopantothenate--cysteine ligase
VTNILIGVSGSIAIYKTLELISLLKETNHNYVIKVVMTHSAQAFINPLTFSTMTEETVYTADTDFQHRSLAHIELARWADHIVIAPASANLLGKMANGLADDLLSTLILASNAEAIIAPAMNKYMWHHAIVQANVATLKKYGHRFLGPAKGDQACGDYGDGRMIDPNVIFSEIHNQLNQYGNQSITPSDSECSDLQVLITAGPTVEPIDPVRYISNYSSGKMGYELARAMSEQGLAVTLISGPVNLSPPPYVRLIETRTTQQMADAIEENLDRQDIFISAAAVCDYRPLRPSNAKIKKDSQLFHLELTKNTDLLKMVTQSRPKPFCVGFAAETNEAEAQAKSKLKNKNLDMIVVNKIDSSNGYPFDSDYNTIKILESSKQQPLETLKGKKSIIAQKLTATILNTYYQKDFTYK